MFDRMKYVVFRDRFDCTAVIMFSPTLKHTDVIYGLELAGQCGKTISAGFVSLEGENIKTYGRSESLNLESRKEDAHLIEINLTEV